MAAPQTPLPEHGSKPVEQPPPYSPDSSSVTQESSPFTGAWYYRLETPERSSHKTARNMGSGEDYGHDKDYDQDMVSVSEEGEEGEEGKGGEGDEEGEEGEEGEEAGSCASTLLPNATSHETECVVDASNVVDINTQEPLQSLDITAVTRATSYQYMLKLEPSRTHLATNPRSEVKLQLTRQPLTFQWRQFDDSPPRPGRFRLASPRDLVQLARGAHECFQFSLELNEQGPPREPYYPVSEQEWRKKLISELRNNLVFVMEWTAICEEEGPTDFGEGGEEDLEASEKYSELFAMCVVSLDGFDPEKDFGEELRALIVPCETGQTMFSHIEKPIQVISLRGEFTYDEQLGLGDNPVGIRAGVTNLPSAGGRHLGSGSGIYLRKTMIGDPVHSLAGKKAGLQYR